VTYSPPVMGGNCGGQHRKLARRGRDLRLATALLEVGQPAGRGHEAGAEVAQKGEPRWQVGLDLGRAEVQEAVPGPPAKAASMRAATAGSTNGDSGRRSR